MRILKIASVLMLFALAQVIPANGQCKTFAKKTCLPELGSYTHDGNYHVTTLTVGEEAELFKTFYSDMEYRLAVCGDEGLPPIEFTVIDANRNILFSSREANYPKYWDFRLESSQQLRIVLKVAPSGTQGEILPSGCVAIMFGFKIK
ncbi:MAG TPA: hypothetical protein PLX08_11860 [Bacteroidales bacterium]|jgi:hypothetical protein|nr:hypothetical protein [Bacteroidales bacterium]